MQIDKPSRYGVTRQTTPESAVDYACESIRHLGCAVVDGGYDPAWLKRLSEAFDRARDQAMKQYGGRESLAAIDEHNTVRLPMAYEPLFLELASNARVLEICQKLIADYVVLNQQNGIVNPPLGARYNQAAWHRDLPYQHFTSSRPLAINALFCLDAFTLENGATKVLPASHQQEDFPSDRFVTREAVTITAPAGSFLVLDCMLFHTGGVNGTPRERRAVNHVYSIPMLRPQIDIPSALGEDFIKDPVLRRLLGYDIRTPRSIGEYLASRKKS